MLTNPEQLNWIDNKNYNSDSLKKENLGLERAMKEIEKKWPGKVSVEEGEGELIIISIDGKRAVYKYTGEGNFLAQPLAPESNIVKDEDDQHRDIMCEVAKILNQNNV